jgi:hypothetical protein
MNEEEKTLKETQKKSDELIRRMQTLLLRVYRKADDLQYRTTLEKLYNKKYEH